MTHTLHRAGCVENLKNDWVILCMPSKDVNHVGSAPKLKRFFELSEKNHCVTMGDCRSGNEYYQGSRSPNEGEREDYGYSKAWIHHKGRNRHHFEYWMDYNPKTEKLSPVKMPQRYVIEMFCDRVAAGKIYNGSGYRDDSPLKYFNGAKKRRLENQMIHPETSAQLEYLLKMLARYGEKRTFAFLRAWGKGVVQIKIGGGKENTKFF